jgi:hypothetical protein
MIYIVQGIVIFVKIKSVLQEMVHYQVVSPVLKVLLVVSDTPVFKQTLLEDVAVEDLLEILYCIT